MRFPDKEDGIVYVQGLGGPCHMASRKCRA